MRALVQEEDNFEAPLTPLIDIVFLLLIFFLAATSFTRREVDQQVNLPAAGQGAAASFVPGSLVVNIRGDATLIINNRVVDSRELPGIIDGWQKQYPGGRVALRGDGNVTYRQVMNVLGICREHGVEKIDLPAGAR